MDNKKINQLLPLFKFNSRILIGLQEDFEQKNIEDGLVIEIDIDDKCIVNSPWSAQKKLKFGFYDAVEEDEKLKLLQEIHNTFDKAVIKEISVALSSPSEEAIASLTWKSNLLK